MLGWDSWDFETRPNLSQDLLTFYLEGEELARAGKLTQANELWLKSAHEAHKSSSSWLSAWFLFHSARQLANAKQWTKASSTFEEAIQGATRSGPFVLIHIFREWAFMFAQRRDLANAEKYYQRALVESQKLGEENLFTSANLDSLGFVAYQSFSTTKAEGYFRQALAMNRKLAPGSLAVASNLNHLSFVAYYIGNLTQTEEYSQQALDIEQPLAPDSILASYSLSYLGIVALERGLLAKAEDYYRQALMILAKNNAVHFVAVSFENLGIIAKRRSDFEKAEVDYRKALAIEKKIAPNSSTTAMILNGLGDLARDRGNEKKAEEYFRQSLVMVKPDDFSLAATLDSLGQIAEDRGDWAMAEAYYRKTLKIRETRNSIAIEFASTLRHIGNVARHYGNLVKAEEYYRRALAILEKQAPGSAEHAESLADLASIMRDKHQLNDAVKLYKQALDAVESQIVHLGGSEESRSGFRAIRAHYFKDYIDLLLSQKQPGQAFQVLERLHARSMLETLQTGHADIRKGVDPALAEKEHSLQESINAKSNRRMQLLGDQKNDERVAAFDKEINDLLGQYKDVEEQIKTSSPAYAALTQPQPITATEVQQQLLAPDTLLLEYSLGEKRSYVFAVTPDSLNAYELPRRAVIERLARRAYELLSRRNRAGHGNNAQQRALAARAEAEYSRTINQLSRMVLGPVSAQLQQKRLLIVSDGALQYIPFSALPVPGTLDSTKPVPLVAEHEIVNLASASVLAVLRREEMERKPAANEVAVIADPVFGLRDERVSLSVAHGQAMASRPAEAHPSDSSDLSVESQSESDLDRSAKQLGISGFPRLPFTRREAEAIYSIAGKTDVLEALDFDASKATALSARLKDYRIVHFATHGLLNNEHPELSGLVFSLVDKQGNEQDGFLRMLDIYNMDLNADLVVLSACQTALGKEVGEEGLIGLTRGFMYAGAPRVVASLWKVDDEATAELMKKFYEGMLRDHQTAAQAMRGAQQWMRTQKAWQAPYYWAGFQLQGEWR